MHAHSPNADGSWHRLATHLHAVAVLAREFAAPLHAPQYGYLLGLWHDVGKAHPQFQQYLADAHQGIRRRGPKHKGAGAVLAERHLGGAAMAIQGHHGGLPSLADFKAALAEYVNDPQVEEARQLAEAEIDLQIPAGQLPQPGHLHSKRNHEFWVRLLFSALVDADFLDTEAHFTPDRPGLRGSTLTVRELWHRFETKHTARVANVPDTVVNRIRKEVHAACLDAAGQDPGFFRLAVPTGGGKTLSGMAFALRHAQLRERRRVVVAMPFISITQQTASVYEKVFDWAGEPSPVLEHHSGATNEAEDSEYADEEVWRRLAAENWDAPIIVTTTVQLFESLFSNRVSACRKLHRLANSVIILDEAQSLPPHLLAPILDGLRELVEHYGTTVVFSTATQPAFESLPAFRDVQAQDIVPNFRQHFQALSRVDYDWRTEQPLAWAEVAAVMRERTQALVIVNTKRDALALVDALEDDEALHLSTLLCGAHRSAVITEIGRRLAEGEPCRVVATQVVEAGVDIDFPLVLRALGPLDSIVQAAGRCNREGLQDKGQVVVFRPEDGGMPPGAYRSGAQTTESLLREGALDPDDPEQLRRYFQRWLQVVDTDPKGIQQRRDVLDYPEVADRFRMIDDDTVSVVVLRYPDPESDNPLVNRLLDQLEREPASARQVRRQLQPFTVAIRRRDVEHLVRDGHVTQMLAGAVHVWHGGYDGVRGIVLTDPEHVF